MDIEKLKAKLNDIGQQFVEMEADYVLKSPIQSTFDKLREAIYFLSTAINTYHFPDEFQFNLNAFIQALRNITFMLQSEDNKPEGFEEWYAEKQEQMRANELLRRFRDGRNIIVKKQMLTRKSVAVVGYFQYRRWKSALRINVSPSLDSISILKKAQEQFYGVLIDPRHFFEWEQIGVERTWVFEDIDEGEIISACSRALNDMAELVSQAHTLYGIELEPYHQNPDIDHARILLETDIDPSLSRKWGWED
jgi:hypothetical protein